MSDSDSDSDYGSLFLWNPLLGSYTKISSNLSPYGTTFGIGYHQNQKLITAIDSVNILELKNLHWRKVEALVDWEIEPSSHGVSVAGNMYWVLTGETKRVWGTGLSGRISFCFNIFVRWK